MKDLNKKKNNIKLTLEDFIKKSSKRHNYFYDYSEVNYINNKTNVTIICPKHGKFSQRPDHHLQGQRCPLCVDNNIKKTTEKFIEESQTIHGDKYDYASVEYSNNHTKVKIICPHHGPFFQKPLKHLQGQGCPICGEKKKINLNGTSKAEAHLFQTLKSRFSVVFKNYKDDPRYPFHCDFYIPERDLFIEYNGYWTHGNRWCDLRNPEIKSTISKWKSKVSDMYRIAVHTFTETDVLKRKTAKKNNLNYVVLWNEQDIEEWFALGCPNGHDGDGMYTWKNCNP